MTEAEKGVRPARSASELQAAYEEWTEAEAEFQRTQLRLEIETAEGIGRAFWRAMVVLVVVVVLLVRWAVRP